MVKELNKLPKLPVVRYYWNIIAAQAVTAIITASIFKRIVLLWSEINHEIFFG